MSERTAWIVRKMDVVAAIGWGVFAILASATDLARSRALMPWCTAAVGAACVLTLMAYLGRRFERLERDAFERGLHAGMDRVIDMSDRR